MTNKYRTYLSDRGIPLLYIGEPCDVPVVTLENYTKWYNIYVVMPDGSVVKYDNGDVDPMCELLKTTFWWIDHLIHPIALHAFAKQIGGCTEERSIEVATARWIFESGNFHHFLTKHNFYDPHL